MTNLESMRVVEGQKTCRDITATIAGYLEIAGDGVVIVEHSDITIAGRLVLRDKAQFVCRDSMLRFAPRPVFELAGIVSDDASLRMTDTVVDSCFAYPAILLSGRSRAHLENVRPETNQMMIAPWWCVFGESRLHAVGSHIAGCLNDAGRMTAEQHSQVRLEMTFGQGALGDLHTVNRPVDRLVIPDTRLKGVDWSCELSAGSLLAGWYTDHRAGSDIAVHGARGLYPAYVWDGKREQVENLRSGIYSDKEWHHNACRLRLVDSLVSRWTAWVTNESNVSLRHCDILDYMVWDRSESTCEDSTIVLAGAKNESHALLRRCRLLTPDWGGSLAAGRNALVELEDCTVDGSVRTVEGGIIRAGVKDDQLKQPPGVTALKKVADT